MTKREIAKKRFDELFPGVPDALSLDWRAGYVQALADAESTDQPAPTETAPRLGAIHQADDHHEAHAA